MKTMYAITHIDRDNLRTLTRGNQGRNHFETLKAAEEHLKAILANTSQKDLQQIFGEQSLNTFKVSKITCYDHGDAVGLYWPECS